MANAEMREEGSTKRPGIGGCRARRSGVCRHMRDPGFVRDQTTGVPHKVRAR